MRFPYRFKFFLFGEKGSLLCAENREMINRVLKEKEMDNKDLKDGDNGGFSQIGPEDFHIFNNGTRGFTDRLRSIRSTMQKMQTVRPKVMLLRRTVRRLRIFFRGLDKDREGFILLFRLAQMRKNW